MPESSEDSVAAAAIERTLTVYERLNGSDRVCLAQVRKAVTTHVYGMVDAGETDVQRLTVEALKALKQRERNVGPFPGGSPHS